jgi:hypothetical protein
MRKAGILLKSIRASERRAHLSERPEMICLGCVSARVFAALLLLAAAGVAVAGPAKKPLAVQWQKFSSPKGKFTVLFPDSPRTVSYRLVEQEELPPIHFYMLKAQSIKGAAFTINHFDVPLPEKMSLSQRYHLLDEMWQAYYGNFKDRVVYKRRIKHRGHPAVEHQLRHPEDPKTLLTGRYISVGNRVYHVFTGMPEPQVKAGHAARFLHSFRILD